LRAFNRQKLPQQPFCRLSWEKRKATILRRDTTTPLATALERLLLEKKTKSSTTSLLATILGNNPTNSPACDNAEENGKVPGYQSTNH
jgi:hypothetical protein